jgi:hypothetical protein
MTETIQVEARRLLNGAPDKLEGKDVMKYYLNNSKPNLGLYTKPTHQ